MTETSIEAFVEIQPSVNRLCALILDAIKQSSDGLTCEQAELQLGMKHQTTSARINELANMTPPLIYKEGKRPNISGRNAAIWFSQEPS